MDLVGAPSQVAYDAAAFAARTTYTEAVAEAREARREASRVEQARHDEAEAAIRAAYRSIEVPARVARGKALADALLANPGARAPKEE